MDASTGLPDDYSELFEQYYSMMCGVVAKSGIAPFDVEDVAMDILARFIDKGGLAYFDPSHPKAKFKGMLRGFTATYVLQYRDKQMIRHRREPWRNEMPLAILGKGIYEVEAESTWGEMNHRNDWWVDSCEVSVSIVQALKKARSILESKTSGKRDYAKFLDLCLLHGFLDGELDRTAIREALGIGGSTLNVMLRELRSTLRPLLADAGVVAVA